MSGYSHLIHKKVGYMGKKVVVMILSTYKRIIYWLWNQKNRVPRNLRLECKIKV